MRKKETKKPWKMAQTAAAVALLVLVTGCGVYAAERILAQKQIAIIDNETEFMENATETTIHYEEFSGENLDFADSKVTDRTEELIQTSDFVGTVTEGTKDDLWSLKAEEKIDGKIEVGYVYPKLSDAFKDQNIGIDVSLPEESFAKRIGESKLTQAQSDKLQDTKDTSELHTPEEIDKSVTHEDMDSFIHTLLIYGSCLKNLELLPKKEKEIMYNDYNLGLCIMLGIFKKNTEEYFNGEVSEMEQLLEKYTPEDICKLKAIMQDVLKISIPIVLQNIALENVGTTKLKSIIEGVIKDKNSSEFARFFSVFMFSDLHLPGLQRVLKEYVAEANNKSLLTIIFFKLLYYYRFRYFSSSLDPFFENILADINIKLHGGNKLRKDRIISELKKQKMIDNT